ncbi:universal stress protein [Silvibacterium sp.]|uniref:universal stress protein n=1 Tax=Silvibacterium sp. TaxID=1964179 RepID=UPI0039E5D110
MNNTLLKFSTVVVATDLSHQASSALRYAQELAHHHNATLVVVHVIDPVGYAFPEGAPQSIAADEQARREFQRIEAELREQNIPVRSVLERGTVCERILQAVADHHADLLVLGTRARTGAGRAALGTIARQLLAKAPCPILTVAPDAEPLIPWAGRWRRILAATDFSAASLTALVTAHRIAGSQLLALHVSHSVGEELSQKLEQLRFLAPFNESHTVPVEHVVTPGDPACMIASFARRTHADLVVLGAPENELTEEDFPASTVMNVIAQVNCPVLCVRAGASVRAEELAAEVAIPC